MVRDGLFRGDLSGVSFSFLVLVDMGVGVGESVYRDGDIGLDWA